MSSTTFGQKGIDAVQRKDYAAAITLLDKALKDSKSPKWLLARAQAQQQLKNWDDALHDAETAYHSAIERGSGDSRKLMIEAQYRRAAIYFKLGRYADADCCAKWSMLLAEGRRAGEDDGVDKNVDSEGHYTVTYADGVADKEGQPGQNGGGIGGQVNTLVTTPKTGFEADWNRAYAFRSQALGALKQLPEDHPGRKVLVSKVPPKTQKKAPQPVESDSDDDLPTSKAANKPEHPAPGSVPDEKMKLRADFYQTNQNITISLFAKDLNKEDIQVQFTKTTARISPIPREFASYVKPGDREATSTLVFGGEIVPSGSRWSATPRKIELVLQKATPGKWSGWGEEKIGAQGPETTEVGSSGPSGTHETSKDAVSTGLEKIVAPSASVAPPEQASAPVYPTSSKLGPKDWDKLGEGEDGDDEDKQDVNYFFKQLYKGSSPEQQRAMMKSFIESNGTALSTDWNDVKSRTVESVPPDGVEAKKWES